MAGTGLLASESVFVVHLRGTAGTGLLASDRHVLYEFIEIGGLLLGVLDRPQIPYNNQNTLNYIKHIISALFLLNLS